MNNQIVLAMMQLPGIGRKTVTGRFDFGQNRECTVENIKKILSNSSKNAIAEGVIETAIAQSFMIINDCKKEGMGIVTWLDEDYPERFRFTDDPPAVLYYKGDLFKINTIPSVAIIGTREPTQIGVKAAVKLGEIFVRYGYGVVSGLAVGCDSFGHKGCLSKNGYTIAILAGGLDSIYPKQNIGLAQEILEKGGCLLSEYPPYTKTQKQYLVERDRLQSGLSDGVVVIETDEDGGAMHAIRYAEKNNRPIACFKHDKKYSEEKKVRGNIMLENAGRAMALGSNDDIDAFCEKMIQCRENRWQVAKNDERTPINPVQMSLFDFVDDKNGEDNE